MQVETFQPTDESNIRPSLSDFIQSPSASCMFFLGLIFATVSRRKIKIRAPTLWSKIWKPKGWIHSPRILPSQNTLYAPKMRPSCHSSPNQGACFRLPLQGAPPSCCLMRCWNCHIWQFCGTLTSASSKSARHLFDF